MSFFGAVALWLLVLGEERDLCWKGQALGIWKRDKIGGRTQLNLSRWVLQEAATSFPVTKVGYGAGARLLSCPPSN